ncbi:type IV pilus assembly protein PilM [Halochromatium glycolicum]|uniref:Pilus assembly protein PilM n=1 Tax=Halochromatium glycolicum TaxID=85075 RepID=A0AAJ0U463_9GAMM|nr:type IV pilus assembly protein PilM [Halochromatium glycolicum]MBK1704788.1 pilus assembly protein PilM [Halochromatium glycolicum]
MFRLGLKHRPLVGVDIGSTAVKLVELGAARAGEAFRVESLGLEPLPAGAVLEKKIADVQKVGEAVGAALGRAGTKTRRAAVAVAGSAVITKVLSLNGDLSDAEMEAQIQLEADQYVPYPLEEVNLDFDVLGPTKGSEGMVDVLLAASRQENVDDRVAALELAGMGAEIVDIESNAIENACGLLAGSRGPEEALVAVADVGASTTTLHVLHNGQNIYAREQSFGGQQLLEEVQRRSDGTVEGALALLRETPLRPEILSEVLEPFQETLARQLARALQFFYSNSPFNQVDALLVTGGVSAVPGLAQVLAEHLGAPARIADPLGEMSLAPNLDSGLITHGRGALLVAVGLAMRRFR